MRNETKIAELTIASINSITEIGEHKWNSFVKHESPLFDFKFLESMEKSGCTSQKNGWEVRILDNLSTGLKQTADALEELGLDVTIGDVRNKELVNKVMEGCDAVVHLAAQPGVRLSIKKPMIYFNSNIKGCIRPHDIIWPRLKGCSDPKQDHRK